MAIEDFVRNWTVEPIGDPNVPEKEDHEITIENGPAGLLVLCQGEPEEHLYPDPIYDDVDDVIKGTGYEMRVDATLRPSVLTCTFGAATTGSWTANDNGGLGGGGHRR